MNKNIYYLAISACQKLVRRGLADEAVKFGAIAHKIDPQRMFSRAFVIIFEEAGHSADMLKELSKWRGNSKDWSTLAPLIRKAAEVTHAREPVFISMFLRRQMQLSAESIHALQTKQPKLWDIREMWTSRDYLSYEGIFGDAIKDEDIIVVPERLSKYDREELWLACPYLHLVEATTGPIDEPTSRDVVLWDDFFPLCAMDGHTRPGKFAIRAFCKKYDHDANRFGRIAFNLDGRCMVNRMTWDGIEEAYFKSLDGTEGNFFFDEELKTIFREETLPAYNRYRAWVLKVPFAEDSRTLKTLYEMQ